MSWEDSFLNWFAHQGIPMTEKSHAIGGLRYFQFSSTFDGVEGKRLSGFGCSTDRKTAALKCAAEAIERKFMDETFHGTEKVVTASPMPLLPRALDYRESEQVALPLTGMKTSNGWAVHSSADKAEETAAQEALERHLLIKSFFRWGWQGFRLHREIQSEAMQIFFMTSRLTSAGSVGGIVVAKSPLYPGVSFGYCVGECHRVEEVSFWQPALLEALNRIFSLGGRAIEIEEGANAWLRSEAKAYLETPFDLEALRSGREFPPEDEEPRSCFIKSFDLAALWNLSFPLYAAYCWGGNLIPLCDQSKLDEEGRAYFSAVLAANDLTGEVPKRHPIL